jgi:PAS domain S-box-containing protein
MTEHLSVLLVEDSPAEARLFREMLKETPGAADTLRVSSVATLADACGWLKGHASDVVVLDLGLPDSAGLDTLRRLRSCAPDVPVVVLTGMDDETAGLEAIRNGAYEYLIKGRTDGRGVTRTLHYAVEQQRAIEALRASEARLRALVDNSFDAVGLLDDGGNFRFASSAAYAILGRTAQSLLGVNVLSLVHADDADRGSQLLSRCLANLGRAVNGRLRVHHADGTWRWLDIVGVNRLDEPAVGGIVVNIRDVTEAVGLEEEQIALRRASAELLDTLNVTELAGKVCRIAVERLGVAAAWVGYAAEDYSVTPLAGWPDLPPHIRSVPVRWDDTPAGQGPTGRAIRSLTPIVCQDMRTDSRLSAWRTVATERGLRSSAALPLISRDRRFGVLSLYSASAGFFTPARIDIFASYAHHAASSLENARLYEQLASELAKRERIESQLRQAQKMEAVGRLAGGIAHDFNNLLTSIIGYAELARDGATAGSQLEKDVQEVLTAADRATSLTKQLLAFGRPQSLLPQRLRLGEIVEEMRRMLVPLIGENIQLVSRVAPDVPDSFADREQIEQAILNLAVNAKDAMPGGGTFTMSVEHASDSATALPANAHRVLLAISDTGCGMDADTVSRVFDPFFLRKARGKATGLGLSTVYSIVQQSGGEITVDSTPGHGTTFRIYLPAHP